MTFLPTSPTEQLFNQALSAHRDGLFEPAQALYTEFLQHHPDHLQARELLGVLYGQQQQFSLAVEHLKIVVEKAPHQYTARTNLGNALMSMKQFEAAIEHLHLAAEHELSYSSQYNFGICLSHLGRYDEAIKVFLKLLSLKQKEAEIWTQIGFCYAELGNHDEALRCNLEALAHDAQHLNAKKNLAFAYLAKQNYALGWHFYESRWDPDTPPPQPTNFTEPKWDGYQSLDNKTIFVYAEQGLGDCIQFARYLLLLAQKGGRVVFYTPHTLRRLLISSQLPIELVTSYKDARDFDYHIPLLTLPLAFATAPESIPSFSSYLRCDHLLIKKWADQLPKKGLKVGIMWRGLSVPHKKRLSIDALENLLQLPNTQFVSLCHDKTSEDEQFLKDHPQILDYAPFDDLADTAALLMNLDIIVTVDTVIAHLAGALGRPCFVVLHRHADWRWQTDGEQASTSAWYPSIRIFRQARADEWMTPIDRVKEALVKGLAVA